MKWPVSLAILLIILFGSPVFAADWPMFRSDLAHTGLSPDTTLSPPLSVKWGFSTGSNIWSSPTVVSGIVFVGSTDHNLYAIDGMTGKLKWTFKTGDSIYSSPTFSDGILYIGSFDKKIYAIEAATGNLKWSYETGGSIYSSPAVYNEVVYIGSGDRRLYAIDAQKGDVKWAYLTNDYISSSPAVSSGSVFFGSWDNNMYCLDAETGALKWTYKTGKGIFSSPAVARGTVYFGSYDGCLYALNAETGRQKWVFTSTLGIFHSSPILAGDMLYVGLSYGNRIYAIDVATGNLKWSYVTGASVGASGAISDGVLYFAASDGKVYAFGDTTPPFASINPLRLAQSSTSFNVSWKGGDFGGSGIKSYDIQYKDGSAGVWRDWLVATTKTHATFGGTEPVLVQDGHTYYFQCRGEDRAGNLGAFKGGDGDTFTTIDFTPPSISEIKVGGVPLSSHDVIPSLPTIEVSISDNVAVNPGSIAIVIDGKSFSPDSFYSGIARYTHRLPLQPGLHTIKVRASDVAGNSVQGKEIGSLAVVEGIAATDIMVSPNPFNPLAGPVHITYKLNIPVDVALYIYDSRGALIWGASFKGGKTGGKLGLNLVDWDGVAGASTVVINGEYTFKLVAAKNLVGQGTIIVKK